jgi:hypothetical protein
MGEKTLHDIVLTYNHITNGELQLMSIQSFIKFEDPMSKKKSNVFLNIPKLDSLLSFKFFKKFEFVFVAGCGDWRDSIFTEMI